MPIMKNINFHLKLLRFQRTIERGYELNCLLSKESQHKYRVFSLWLSPAAAFRSGPSQCMCSR